MALKKERPVHLQFLPVNKEPHATAACDGCAARKVKCSGKHPCQACVRAGIDCTRARPLLRRGPKTIRASTRSAIRKLQRRGSSSGDGSAGSPRSEGSLGSCDGVRGRTSPVQEVPISLRSSKSSRRISLAQFTFCLDLFHHELLALWPVVRRKDLISRLQNPGDIHAYALAAALCAVTTYQLNLAIPDHGDHHMLTGAELIEESERCRRDMSYEDLSPSIDTVMCSFFLHIALANSGRVQKATLRLREAITFVHMLGYHRPDHYSHLNGDEAQLHLRLIWLLFITEKGHSTRFDLPTMSHISPDLPALRAEEDPALLGPFISLCKLFYNFNDAMTRDLAQQTYETFISMQKRLNERSASSESNNDLQRADLQITQQWMQLLLWKLAICRLTFTTNAQEEFLDLFFPERIARRVLTSLGTLPRYSVESHGLGMGMKLCEVAISLADLISCSPSDSTSLDLMQVGSRDILASLASFLASFRGGTGPSWNLLQQKIVSCGIGIPAPAGFLELEESDYTDETGLTLTENQPLVSLDSWFEF